MSWPDGTDVPLGSLDVGGKLNSGGQGVIYRLPRRPGILYKRYHDVSKVNGDALRYLVDLPSTVDQRERDDLLDQAAWPLARVIDGGGVVGFLMSEAPARFESSDGAKLRELQYLLYEAKPMWGDILPLEIGGRLEFLRRAMKLFNFLHSKNIIVGDISLRNILWSPPPVSAFLLDCDAMRGQGRSPVLPQPHTPDWDDPEQPPSGPDLDSDRYKLALLVGRTLSRNAELRPGDTIKFIPGLPDRVAGEVAKLFAEASRPRGLRPDTGHWIIALSNREILEFEPPPQVRQRPDIPLSPGAEGARPTIQLQPPDPGRKT